ncbi:GNAT family N-acetyltransferase [Maribacter sp. 4G9]|uniref:GNAT family N-acetyltransferase n=1 Tax=Maribacter sp. 4G9 TaxID=1889777 RepID=UPI000C154F1D|nr:GNAT family N-acetyltransferase [Maribacter sp. 4G9]PIB37916.1 phosphinothricin acetyltransferase [Maribacter sp. 4G9]
MLLIRTMDPADWHQVSNIYLEGIETGMATFETIIPSYGKWDGAHLKNCRFVAIANKEVAGWAALSPVSSRYVYRGVAEVSIYIGEKYRGLGVGNALMKHLILESEAQGFWTLQSGIFPTNKASIKLHESVGFRKIGVRERVGNLNGVWIDNVLYERRSKVIGID